MLGVKDLAQFWVLRKGSNSPSTGTLVIDANNIIIVIVSIVCG